MDKTEVIYFLINRWFKEYNFLFTLTDDYNEQFKNFVYNIVEEYLEENNLMNISEELMWAHIRFIVGNTYKKEIEIFKNKKNVEGQR